MNRYLIVAEETGLPLRMVTCTPDTALLQAQAGELLCEISEQQSDGWRNLRRDGGAVVSIDPPAPSLQQLRARRWEDAKAYRDERINGGCSTSFGQVDSDETSRNYMLGARELARDAITAGSTQAVGWKMADNAIVALSPSQLLQMTREVGLFVAACQAAAQAIGVAIEVTADPAAIDITAGYPPA